MKSIARIGMGITIATSLCASYAFAQVQIQPVQPTRPVTKPAPVKPTPPTTKPMPVRPGGPQIQPPRPQPPKPVKPRPPIQPPRPRPPKPVKPRPPQYNYEYNWRHHYRPPHYVGWNQAILFTSYYGGGQYMTVRHNIPDLRRYGYGDRTRSLYATGRWMVCSKTNYRGTCRTYRGRQGSLGSLNGRVSSIRFVGR
jgi:hypothetical protein